SRKDVAKLSLFSWARWTPLAATLIAIILAAGIDAFQILETMQAQKLSIRRELTYELFAMGSYSLLSAVKSFFIPLHNVFEATAAVPPLVLILALISIGAMLAKPEREWRVFFWATIAVAGFVLMLGQNTPLAAILYRLPPFNLFRGAARHAFEFTLAIGVLSAFGWDVLIGWKKKGSSSQFAVIASCVLLLLTLIVGILWMRDVAQSPVGYMELFFYPPEYSVTRYLVWKLAFDSLSICGIWLLVRTDSSFRFRSAGILACILRNLLLYFMVSFVCFVQPAIMVSRWWWPTLKPASRFTAVSPATRRVQSSASGNRVYTHVYPMVEEYADPPRLEPANLTMLNGLDNVAGNEPLMLDRYSRALGDVYIDAVKTRLGYPTDGTLFAAQSRVLDLLNTGFVVSYSYLSTEPVEDQTNREIRINPRGLELSVEPHKAVTLAGAAADADTLALVTATAWSAEAVDGTEVARVRLTGTNGRSIERSLVLGRDTAEWSYDRAPVKPLIRHSKPRVFSSRAEDRNDPEPAYKFITSIAFGERMMVDRIEITNVSDKIILLLSHASLYDSATKFSMPLPQYDLTKWEPVYDENGALILRNRNVLPRAWLVSEAEAVSSDEALRRIKGQGAAFDPRRTALLEVEQKDLPALPGGYPAADSSAQITRHEANKIIIDTKAPMSTMMILSEVNYPGWIATLDGAEVPIYTADFMLRGVVVPAGSHRIE